MDSDGLEKRLTAAQLQLRSPPLFAYYCGMKLLAHNSKPLHGSPRPLPVRLQAFTQTTGLLVKWGCCKGNETV
jgi:hypothetical protein